MINRYLLIICTGLSLLLLSGCPGGKPEIIEKKCSTCHSASVVYAQKRTIDEWGRLVYGMKVRGLQLTPDEESQVLEALARYYSSD